MLYTRQSNIGVLASQEIFFEITCWLIRIERIATEPQTERTRDFRAETRRRGDVETNVGRASQLDKRRPAMSTNIAVFGFGAILLLVAIVGGGFEVREFKIPKVGWVARLIAGFAGGVFVLIGFGISSTGIDQGQENKETRAQAAMLGTPQTPAPVEFTVFDQLGNDGRVSEQITISVDGKFVGQLTANQQDPRSMLTVTEPSAGRYSYSIFATKVMYYNGKPYRHEGTGQGMISVSQGKKFELVESTSGNTWLVSLVEQSELEKTR